MLRPPGLEGMKRKMNLQRMALKGHTHQEGQRFGSSNCATASLMCWSGWRSCFASAGFLQKFAYRKFSLSTVAVAQWGEIPLQGPQNSFKFMLLQWFSSLVHSLRQSSWWLMENYRASPMRQATWTRQLHLFIYLLTCSSHRGQLTDRGVAPLRDWICSLRHRIWEA